MTRLTSPETSPSQGSLWSDGMSFLALGLVALSVSGFVPEDSWNSLGFFCLTGLALAFARLWKLFRRGQEELISNVFLTFTLVFAVFFLFSPLLHVFGPPDQAEFAREWFPVNASQAVYLVGANLVGFGLALCLGETVRWTAFSRMLTRHFSGLPQVNAHQTALLLLALGILFKVYVLYNDLVLDRIISGLFRIGSMMAPAGVFLYLYKVGPRPTPTFFIAILTMVLYVITGFIEFSKTEMLLPLLAMMGGMLAQRVTILRLVLYGVIVGAILTVLQPVNLVARNQSLLLETPTYKERLEIFRAAINGEFEMPESMGAWARLDYTSPQQAAVYLYRKGDGGSDGGKVFWAFIPRFLFPKKPIITGAATEFTYKIRGFDTSATAVGVFINGFYNAGWAGLIFVSLTVGLILSWFRAVLVAAHRSGSILLLCIGLFGHMTAIFISGSYLANFLSPFVTMFYLILGLTFVLIQLRPYGARA